MVFSILAIFKNESYNIVEWIEHYINQGVKKIYMIDNGSDDNYSKLIEPYKKYIEIFNKPDRYKQTEHYNDIYCILKNRNELTEWLGILDLDEFCYSPKSNIYTELQKINDNFHEIIIDSFPYGSSKYVKHPYGNVRKLFKYRNKNKASCKYFFRTKYINPGELGVHSLVNSQNYIIDNDTLRTNHYLIQSKEYFENIQIKRGDVKYSFAVKDWNYFNRYDNNAKILDNELADKIYDDYAYVCFTKSDNYINLLNILVEAFEKFSKYKLYIYLICNENDFYENQIKLSHKIKIIPINYINECKSMYNYKAYILADYIDKKFSKYACYLDIDCIITPNMDNIFSNINLVDDTEYPISCVHPVDVVMPEILYQSMKIENKTTPFIHNDIILFSDKHYNFMKEWYNECIKNNYITVFDEYIYNMMLWKYNCTKYLKSADFYYESFYTVPEIRDDAYIYHGSKDHIAQEKLLEDIVKYYSFKDNK